MRNILFILFVILLALTSMAAASYTTISAVTTLDSDNDNVLAPSAWTTLATGSNYNQLAFDGAYKYVIGVNVTAVGDSPKFNIEHGDFFRSSIGDASYALTNNTVQYFGPLESARFLNSTGYLTFSTTNVTTGKIMVLKVLR